MSVLQHDVYRFLQCSKVLWSRSLTSLPSAGPLLNISKTDLNDLPLLKFSGKVCVIRSTGDEERFQKEIDQMCRAGEHIKCIMCHARIICVTCT